MQVLEGVERDGSLRVLRDAHEDEVAKLSQNRGAQSCQAIGGFPGLGISSKDGLIK